jgi:hypothetical protein
MSLIKSVATKTKYNKDISPKSKQQTRMALSSIMIYHCPSDMLDENDINNFENPLSEQVYLSATNIINCIINKNNLNNNKIFDESKKLWELINIFLTDLENWKKKDIHKLVDSLKNLYREWSKSEKVMGFTNLDNNRKTNILNTVTTTKESVKNKMIKLLGKEQTDIICKQIEIEVEQEPEILEIEQNSCMLFIYFKCF